MANKNIPHRKCVATNQILPKSDLIRIVRFNGQVVIDLTGHHKGRGAYIKKDINALEKAIMRKALQRHLEVTIDESIFIQLRQIINDQS